MACPKEGPNASREGCDAPGARDSSTDVFQRNSWPRDRPASGDRGLDSASGPGAVPVDGAGVAASRRHDRRGAGGQALRQRRHQAGPPPPRRAGLGPDPPRAQAQARNAVDPVGGVCRAGSERLSLLALCCAGIYVARRATGQGCPLFSLARAAHNEDGGLRPKVPSGKPSTRGARRLAAAGGADRRCRRSPTPWPSSPYRPPHRHAWCRARRDPARLGSC